MGKGRVENLRALTTEEAREIGRKGGLAAAKSKKDKRTLREALQALLQAPADDEGNSGMAVLATTLFQKALEGDVRAICEIRDSIGEMPTAKLQAQMQGDNGFVVGWIGDKLLEARERVKRLRNLPQEEESIPQVKTEDKTIPAIPKTIQDTGQRSTTSSFGYKDGSQLDEEMARLQEQMKNLSGRRVW